MNQEVEVSELILKKIRNAIPSFKMPLMYLMDSIIKNVTTKYIALFGSQMAKLVAEVFPTLSLDDQSRLRYLVSSWRTMGTFTLRYVGVIEQGMMQRHPPPQQFNHYPPPPPQQQQQHNDSHLRVILVQLQQSMNIPMSQRMSLEQARLPQNVHFYKHLLSYAAANSNLRSGPRIPPQHNNMMHHQRGGPPIPQPYPSIQQQQLPPAFIPETKTAASDELIKQLYGGHQDSTSGLRFPSEKDPRYAAHLDLRFKRTQYLKKLEAGDIMASRSWFCSDKEWDKLSLSEIREIQQKTAFSSFQDPDTKECEEEERDTPPGVAANEKQTVCPICQVPFERIKWTSSDGFDTIWLYDKTMYAPGGSRKILHIECYRESVSANEKKEEKEEERMMTRSRKRSLSGENGSSLKKRAKIEVVKDDGDE
jgi:hypothetical protein